jgi:hypothetical protein
MRVEQRVGQGGFVAEVVRVAQQRQERIVARQRSQAGSQLADLRRARADPDPPAVVLQQVDAGDASRRAPPRARRTRAASPALVANRFYCPATLMASAWV